MRALLIEDDGAMARSIELLLRSEGFSVCTADLGKEGIDLSKLNNYDIIVLDLQLPDMSGFEVLTALRIAQVLTPVLILSGNTIVETKVKALSFGADDYVTKPLHKDEFVARIRAVMRRSKKHGSSQYGSNIASFAVYKERGILALAKTGGSYIKMEWETGYMLRDLDCGQVVVA